MRFLADESCDFGVVRALRTGGHDVLAVVEIAAGAEDEAVAGLAVREGRVLLTEDKDFGQLVWARAQPAVGVILIRFPGNAWKLLPAAVTDWVSTHADRITGSFVVFSPGQVRSTRMP